MIQWKHWSTKNIEIKIVTCEKCWTKNSKMQKISKQTQLNVKNIQLNTLKYTNNEMKTVKCKQNMNNK